MTLSIKTLTLKKLVKRTLALSALATLVLSSSAFIQIRHLRTNSSRSPGTR
ncbi:hypothetical protein [Hafnia psychrotolerans]|uniref:hypothetical protein n=1 Tax=Hafnia psychrotolerans TaxID=1477018 RepID=UPI001667B933|nr:hypothetical protein [Hafnia psychrotolerans]